MGKNKKGRIVISFVGENASDVTGSSIHIQLPSGKQILLECGLYQSCKGIAHDYKVNFSRLKYHPKEIDYVFVCHNHIDHIGKLPYLYKKGSTAQIVAPEHNKAIAKALLDDCAYICEKDVETLKRRDGNEHEPLYTSSDVDLCLTYYHEYPLNERIQLDDEISFQFIHSGHILNSAQLVLWLKVGTHVRKIVYTSDLGNCLIKKKYANEIQFVDRCDVLIGETTYAREKKTFTEKDREKDLKKLSSIIQQTCIENNGKILIPVFANDRCQNIFSYIYDLYGNDPSFKVKVLVDSPMAVKISKMYGTILDDSYYNKVLSWDNLVFVEGYEQSKAYQGEDGPMIILSCGGMMQAGRVLNWASKIIPNSNNHIVFCGYAPPDSLAGKIKAGIQKYVSVAGRKIANRCNVTILHTFSSHIQRESLIKYYSDVYCEKVALVHGEFDGKIEFAKDLQEEISRKNRTSKVICVNKSTEIKI